MDDLTLPNNAFLTPELVAEYQERLRALGEDRAKPFRFFYGAPQRGKKLSMAAHIAAMTGAGIAVAHSGAHPNLLIHDELERSPDPTPAIRDYLAPGPVPGPTGKPERSRSKAKAARKARRITRQGRRS